MNLREQVFWQVQSQVWNQVWDWEVFEEINQ
jgi:hypothetical protein